MFDERAARLHYELPDYFECGPYCFEMVTARDRFEPAPLSSNPDGLHGFSWITKGACAHVDDIVSDIFAYEGECEPRFNAYVQCNGVQHDDLEEWPVFSEYSAIHYGLPGIHEEYAGPRINCYVGAFYVSKGYGSMAAWCVFINEETEEELATAYYWIK